MGNFYTNIVARGADQRKLSEWLSAENRRAYVSPTVNRCTVVFDEAMEEQDPEVVDTILARLSEQFQCAAIGFLNHDDDILGYHLYETGARIDEYNSSPEYFETTGGLAPPSGGDAAKLCAAFGVVDAVGQVEQVLRKSSAEQGGYVFAFQRHLALIDALRLPGYPIGYVYIVRGELPPELDASQLIQTGI